MVDIDGDLYHLECIERICLLWRKIKTVPMLESLIKTGWCNEFLKVFYGACRHTWLNLKSKTYYGVFGLNRQEMRIAGKTHDLQEVERAHSWKAAGLAITEENLKMVKKISHIMMWNAASPVVLLML